MGRDGMFSDGIGNGGRSYGWADVQIKMIESVFSTKTQAHRNENQQKELGRRKEKGGAQKIFASGA